MGRKRGGGSGSSIRRTYEPKTRFSPKAISQEEFAKKFVDTFGGDHQSDPVRKKNDSGGGMILNLPRTPQEEFEIAERRRLQKKKLVGKYELPGKGSASGTTSAGSERQSQEIEAKKKEALRKKKAFDRYLNINAPYAQNKTTSIVDEQVCLNGVCRVFVPVTETKF